MQQNSQSKIIIQRLRLNQTLKEIMNAYRVSDITLAQQTNQTTADVDKDLNDPTLSKSKFAKYQRAFFHISKVLKDYDQALKSMKGRSNNDD